MEQQLSELLDRQAITDVIYGYCLAVDRLDFKAMTELYHPDGFDDHGHFGEGPVKNFFSFVEKNVAGGSIGRVHHAVTNIVLKLDGDYAESQSWFFGFHVIEEEGKEPWDYVIIGRFLDKFEKRNGQWKIFHRRVVPDMTYRTERSTMRLDDPLAAGFHLGQGGQKDPSYNFFKLFKWGSV